VFYATVAKTYLSSLLSLIVAEPSDCGGIGVNGLWEHALGH